MSDGEVSKLLIVTQTPQRPKKHEGFDRTADSVSRVKMSQVRSDQSNLCILEPLHRCLHNLEDG